MPFITMERRKQLEEGAMPEKLGDLCYLFYVPMVKQFRENESWTTIHNISRDYRSAVSSVEDKYSSAQFTHSDYITASDLAWEVFWVFYGIPYEVKKRKINGDI